MSRPIEKRSTLRPYRHRITPVRADVGLAQIVFAGRFRTAPGARSTPMASCALKVASRARSQAAARCVFQGRDGG
jgi:hypothetical protein